MLASSAPGPFEGLIGVIYALALLVVGVGLLLSRGGLWLYPFAVALPLVPLLYVFAVLLRLLPPQPPPPVDVKMDTNWGFVTFMITPSLAAAIALLLVLRSGRTPSGLN
jgi:hypothetical protein